MSEASYNPDRDTEYQPTNDIDADRIRGIYKDSSGKLWSIYLSEADKQDKEMIEFWKGEADTSLVFNGLFSGLVSGFLTTGISDIQQARFPPPNSVTPSMVYSVLWLLSLLLSLSSAICATLCQQWSRRYLELVHRRVAPHKRARIRGYIFGGVSTFKMSLTIKLMPVLLHLSMFIFFAGLVVYLWVVDPVIGSIALGCLLVFTFGYVLLTMLPYIYLNSPYSTPFSEFAWRTTQRFLLAIFFLTKLLQGLSLSILSLLSRWGLILQHTEELRSRWTQWERAVKARIRKHKKWLEDGLLKSIINSATDAPSDMDKDALAWTLTVLDDDREFEDFVARIPGFLNSKSIPHASSVILPLMDVQSDQSDQYDPILGTRIIDLLKTCVPGTPPLQEELRRNRLRVCMRTLWYCTKEYNRTDNVTPLPSYIRTAFVNPEMTYLVQFEEDLAARFIGRSFSTLFAKRLARDIGSRAAQGHPPSVGELSCLAAVLGKTSREVVDLLNQPGSIGLTGIVSLISSEMDTLVNARVPSEVQDIFRTTLDTLLLAEDLRVLPNAELPPDLVATFHETYANAQRLEAPGWLISRLGKISEALSMNHEEPELPRLALPEHEPGSPSNTSDISRSGSASPLLGYRTLSPL